MRLALGLALLVFLAGCAGTSPSSSTLSENETTATSHLPETEISTAGTPTTPITGASEFPGSNSTADPTRDIADLSPWNKRHVSVALVTGDRYESFYSAALNSTIQYWNSHQNHTDYPVTFSRVTSRADADIRVKIVDNITACDGQTDIDVAGCAPVLSPLLHKSPSPVTVKITDGYTQNSTRYIMKHEFGHIAGLTHGDTPRELMQAQYDIAVTAQPDAVNKSYPWRTANFTVFTNTTTLNQSQTTTASDQISRALAYYTNHSTELGLPSDLSFTGVRSPENATIHIRVIDTNGSAQSTASYRGSDTDNDGTTEWYTTLEINATNIQSTSLGWHTGHWLGRGLGLSSTELPTPLQRANSQNQTTTWWNTGPKPDSTS